MTSGFLQPTVSGALIWPSVSVGHRRLVLGAVHWGYPHISLEIHPLKILCSFEMFMRCLSTASAATDGKVGWFLHVQLHAYTLLGSSDDLLCCMAQNGQNTKTCALHDTIMALPAKICQDCSQKPAGWTLSCLLWLQLSRWLSVWMPWNSRHRMERTTNCQSLKDDRTK